MIQASKAWYSGGSIFWFSNWLKFLNQFFNWIFREKKVIEWFVEFLILKKTILNNPLNWILLRNEWINHILNQTSLWIDLVEIKWRVSFHSKFTRFFEDKLCTSKSNYTANIFPSTILKKEEELDSPKLVANVTTWVPYTTLKRFPSCYASSSIISASLMIFLGKMMLTLFATSVLFKRSRTDMFWLKIISARTRGDLALLLIHITHLLLCFPALRHLVIVDQLDVAHHLSVVDYLGPIHPNRRPLAEPPPPIR